MNKAISNKEHREGVMLSDINRVVKYVNSFKNYDIYKVLKKNIGEGNGKKTFFEVGAAPGRDGISFEKYFGYIPGGIEYTDNGFEAIKQTLQYFNIKQHNYIKGDFLGYDFKEKYDLVYSGGFIEHFKNYKEIVEKHIEITKKGGLIVISIPNYHQYFRSFQELLYPGLIKDQHNTQIMNIKCFTNLFNEIRTKGDIKIKYIGGFGKATFGQLVSKNNFIQKTIYAIDIICMKLGIYKILPKEYSSIICIVEKL